MLLHLPCSLQRDESDRVEASMVLVGEPQFALFLFGIQSSCVYVPGCTFDPFLMY